MKWINNTCTHDIYISAVNATTSEPSTPFITESPTISSTPPVSKNWKLKPTKPKNLSKVYKFKKHVKKVRNHKKTLLSLPAAESNFNTSVPSPKSGSPSTEITDNSSGAVPITLSVQEKEELNLKIGAGEEIPAFQDLNELETEKPDDEEDDDLVVTYQDSNADEIDNEYMEHVDERAANEEELNGVLFMEAEDPYSLVNSIDIGDNEVKDVKRMTNLKLNPPAPIVYTNNPELVETTQPARIEINEDFIAEATEADEPVEIATTKRPRRRRKQGRRRRLRRKKFGRRLNMRGRQGADNGNIPNTTESIIENKNDTKLDNDSITDLSKVTLYNECTANDECHRSFLCVEGNEEIALLQSEIGSEDTDDPAAQDKIKSRKYKKCTCPSGDHVEILTKPSLNSTAEPPSYTISCGLGPTEICRKNEECASRICTHDTKRCDFIMPPHGLIFIDSIYYTSNCPHSTSSLNEFYLICVGLLGVYYFIGLFYDLLLLDDYW